MTQTTENALFSHEQNEAAYELLAAAARARQQGNDGEERSALSILKYNSKNPSPFHDLNQQYFPTTIEPDYSTVKFLAEFAVGGFKMPDPEGGTPIIDTLIDQADASGLTRVVAESVLGSQASNNTLVVTGHGDLFEPIIAVLPGLLGAARRARNQTEQTQFLQKLLRRTDLFVSRYLTTYAVALDEQSSKTPLIGLLRNGCGVYTTFPNTENGKAIGVDEEVVKLHNQQLLEQMDKKDPGNIVIVAGSATEEKIDEKGVKIIKEPNVGTGRLAVGRKVVAVAYVSGSQADRPIILDAKVIKPNTEPNPMSDGGAVEEAMLWIAKTRTSAGYPARVETVFSKVI